MSLAGLGSTGQTQLEKDGVSVWVWIDFLSGSCGVLGRWKQERTVVLAHAPMTPGKIEQEEHAHSLQPCAGLGTVNFQIAAVWAGVVQCDSKHYKIVLTLPSASVLGAAIPANPLLPGRCNWRVLPRTFSLAPRLILLL
jgi:hypothetical protein